MSLAPKCSLGVDLYLKQSFFKYFLSSMYWLLLLSIVFLNEIARGTLVDNGTRDDMDEIEHIQCMMCCPKNVSGAHSMRSESDWRDIRMNMCDCPESLRLSNRNYYRILDNINDPEFRMSFVRYRLVILASAIYVLILANYFLIFIGF